MVSEVLEKLKKIGTKEPISKEDANILALTGRVCTLEDRVSEFLKSVNEVIVAKARDQQFMHLIIVPKDILVKSKEIQEILSNRGFNIHILKPEIPGTFVIDWQ